MANNELTSNTWLTAGKTAVQAADVYKQTGTAPINSIESFYKKFETDLLGALRGGQQSGNGLSIIKSITGDGKLVIDKNALIQRIALSSGPLVAGIRSAAKGITDGIASSFKVKGDVFAIVGDVKKRVDSTALNDINSLGTLLNTYTQGTALYKIVDKDGQVGLLSGIAKECMSKGVPGAFAALTKDIKDPLVVKRIAGNILGDIVKRSDAGSLKDVGAKLGNGGAKAVNPNFVGDFSKNYQKPPQTTMANKVGEWQTVTDAYKSADSEWHEVSRTTLNGNEKVVNLTGLMQASPDFKEVITVGAKVSTNPQDKVLGLSTILTPLTVEESLMQNFPRTISTDASISSDLQYTA